MNAKTRDMIVSALASVAAAIDLLDPDPRAALDDLAAARLLLTAALAVE